MQVNDISDRLASPGFTGQLKRFALSVISLVFVRATKPARRTIKAALCRRLAREIVAQNTLRTGNRAGMLAPLPPHQQLVVMEYGDLGVREQLGLGLELTHPLANYGDEGDDPGGPVVPLQSAKPYRASRRAC